MTGSSVNVIATFLIVAAILVYYLALFCMVIVGFRASQGAGLGVLLLGWLFYLWILFQNPKTSKMPIILTAVAGLLLSAGISLL